MARPIAWMGSGGPLPASDYPPTRPFAHRDHDGDLLDDPGDIGGTAGLPPMSRLPSYATTDPSSAPAYSAAPVVITTQDLRRLFQHAYEIRHTKPGLTVALSDTDEPLYYIGRYSALDTPDIIIYRGTSSHGPICAQARLTSTKDLDYLIGANEASADTDWFIAKNISEGRIFTSDSWHFSPPPAVAGTPALELAWKQTHDAHLGSGKLRSKDFKLVDAATDSVLAVYLDSGPSDISIIGRLEFRHALASVEAELAALVVLMAMRERTRRHTKRQGVVNRSQDVALRHGI